LCPLKKDKRIATLMFIPIRMIRFISETTLTRRQSGTLVHEMSHYNSVGGTDDVVMSDGKTAYGQKRCEKLAKEDPAGAKNNADSFEYFR